MTNQMKKILMVCLVLAYVNFVGLTIVFIASGFAYKYVFSYAFLGLSIALCVYFQYLKLIIMKEDKAFAEQIFYAKKLLELRELAKLRFYKSRGLEPRYNEDGTVMDPDTFIGILTKLDENGQLQKSIYEILGIEPVFDKNGKEIPVIVVLKHLMKKPRTSNFNEIKGLSKKMVLKGTQKAEKQEDKSKEKKKEQAKPAPSASKPKKEVPGIYARYEMQKEKDKKKDKVGGGNKTKDEQSQKSEKSSQRSPGEDGERTPKTEIGFEERPKVIPSMPVSINKEPEQDIAIME